MPGQLFHLAVLINNSKYEDSVSEFIMGGLIVDCLTPSIGRWRSHFCLDKSGWDIPETWNDISFPVSYYGEISDSESIVDPYPDMIRIIAMYKPNTSFRRGVICHLLTDYFNQRIRFEENYDFRIFPNEDRIRLKQTGEILDKATFKKRAQSFYPAESQYVANICGLTEYQLKSIKNFLKNIYPNDMFYPLLDRYLTFDNSAEFTSNEYVTSEQLNRIVSLVHNSMISLKRNNWLIL